MKPSFATSRSGSSGTHPTPRPPFGQSAGRPQAGGQGPGGRKPGGQSGHPGHHRHCLPPERVKNIVPYVPTVCTQCQAPLPAEPGPGDPDPSWRQVAELPELAAVITEHPGHARTCPCCGYLNCGRIPQEIRAHVIGPRFGCGNVLLQRPSSSWPTGCERGRRDRLRGADLPGLHLRAES